MLLTTCICTLPLKYSDAKVCSPPPNNFRTLTCEVGVGDGCEGVGAGDGERLAWAFLAATIFAATANSWAARSRCSCSPCGLGDSVLEVAAGDTPSGSPLPVAPEVAAVAEGDA